MFRDEMTPDACWDLITHLPADSALMAALADDPEYAADDDGPGEPRWTEFSPETRVLADIYDMLAVLVRQVAALGGKPPKIPPYPRPGEARRRELAARRDAEARAAWADICEQLGVN